MQKRLFGLETEYALVTDEEFDWLAIQELLGCLQKLPIDLFGQNTDNYIVECWLENGARIYRDQSHPEYATAECENVYNLICHERAGDELLKAAYDIYLQKHPEARGKIRLFKSNFAAPKIDEHTSERSEEVSWGSHENYLVAKKAKIRLLEENLPPMLVSRQIFSGAGHIQPLLERFVLSGRPYHLTQVGNIKDGGHAKQAFFVRAHSEASDIDHDRWWRIQVSSSESNMLEFPVWLRFMTTHFCLRMAEEGLGISKARYLGQNSTDVFKKIGEDILLKATIPTRSYHYYRALEFQRYYLERAKRLAPLNAEEQMALRDWEWILGLLDCDLEQDENLFRLFGVLDWATKLWLIKQLMRKNNLALDSQKVAALDACYHLLGGAPGESVWLALEAKDRIEPFIKRFVRPEDIKRAINTPPDSRARLRSDFLKLSKKIKAESPEFELSVTRMDWGNAWFYTGKNNNRGCVDFGIKNPFLKKSNSLERFREKYANGT